MARITKTDVESMLSSVNQNIPQKPKAAKREIKADYMPQYGGWLFRYYDETYRSHAISNLRFTNAEAYRLLEGILFNLTTF